MNKYTLLKSSFLGTKGATVELNKRQASSLLAGGFIATEAAKPNSKKTKEPVNADAKA